MFLLLILVGCFSITVKCQENLTCNLPCQNHNVDPLSRVVQFCQFNHFPFGLGGRCCFSTTERNAGLPIVGVDLSNCSLKNVTDLFKNMTSLVYLSLENNPSLYVSAADFYQLTKLNYLSLPSENSSVSCPGDYFAWKNIAISDNHVECEDQLDTCTNSENNGTCPSPQSTCSPAGPGLVDCFCSPGYHGYKCLRQGTFPVAPFVGGLAGTTFVLAGFLWVTQRRHVKKHTS